MSPWAWSSVDKGRRAQETGVAWTGGNEDTLATTGRNGHLASECHQETTGAQDCQSLVFFMEARNPEFIGKYPNF